MIAKGLRKLTLSVLVVLGASAAASTIALAQSGPPAADDAHVKHPPALDATTLAAGNDSLRALVVARGDCVVFEYYRLGLGPGDSSPVYSVAKSVLSILVGIAIDKGYLHLDEKLSEIMPSAFDNDVDPRVGDITVRDFLTKTEGFGEVATDSKTTNYPANISYPTPDMWKWMLNRPLKYAPGSHFRYDGVSANLLSVALSLSIKESAEKFAQDYLLGPLGIKNYSWVTDAQGHLFGESDLTLTPRDMAKIGLLYLNGGRWGDRQIVSEPYVRASTTKQSDGGPPVHAAYGYLWWVRKTKAGDDAFFAAGHKSQIIYVVPKRGVVVAMSADGIPGGSSRFMDDVVMPAEAELPSATPCISRLESHL